MQEPQEMRVWSLALEDPLEKGMAPHSSILAWRIPRTEVPGGLQSMGLQRIGHDRVVNYSDHRCSCKYSFLSFFLSPSSLSLSLILEEAFKFTLERRTGMVCGSQGASVLVWNPCLRNHSLCSRILYWLLPLCWVLKWEDPLFPICVWIQGSVENKY